MADRTIPAEWQPLIDSAVTWARRLLERGEELCGTAFIDAPEMQPPSSVPGLIIIPMSEMLSKDAWARAVRTVSSFAEARFVMVASEVWLHETGSKGEAHRAELNRLLDQHGEVRLIPGRREAMLVQIETHDGMWQGIADVVPLAVALKAGCKTFGALELTMPKHNEGRLVGLLGSKRPKQ